MGTRWIHIWLSIIIQTDHPFIHIIPFHRQFTLIYRTICRIPVLLRTHITVSLTHQTQTVHHLFLLNHQEHAKVDDPAQT